MAECIICGGGGLPDDIILSFNGRIGDVKPQSGDYTASMVGAASVNHTHTQYVPTSRTINGKSLTSNINLSASDVGAASSNHSHSNYALTNHTHNGLLNGGTIPVSQGGTGLTSLSSGYVLVGNGTSAVSLRAITNNVSSTSPISANTNLVTMNTLRYAMNRTTGIGSADTNYSTSMVRGIQLGTTDLTAGSSSLTSGSIYFMYE